MKRSHIFVFIAVLLLGLLALLISAERADRRDSSGQISTKLEQQETRQEESSRVSTEVDLSSENRPSGSPGGQASKEDGKKAASGAASKVSRPTFERSTSSSGEGASSKDSGDAQNSEKVPGIRVGVAVVGKKGELLFGPAEVVVRADSIWGITALGALDATGLPYEMSPRFPDLVVAVAGQRNEGQSGWMYKVNDEVPLVAASKRRLQEGDRVIWWYSTSISNPPPQWSSLKKSG
ncbi:MAG: Uncharacterized protein XD63_1527 [Thermoanaerobacterales bacterium 50_218]|nr:MAG: Uncharacterized protein XD63_1527 [Thermoanaerobacterales bacterium 50_218]HAA89562.1 hypothetical protein [Peptococcaceae bacterium]